MSKVIKYRDCKVKGRQTKVKGHQIQVSFIGQVSIREMLTAYRRVLSYQCTGEYSVRCCLSQMVNCDKPLKIIFGLGMCDTEYHKNVLF